MASSSLTKNTNFDKLLVNKLQANDILANDILADNINADDVEANEITDNDPSYLFSVVSDNVTFTRTSTGGTLTFLKAEFDGKSGSVIEFTDRPLRQSYVIPFDELVDEFEDTDFNSFEEDPPNAVLRHEEEQRTYKVKLMKNDDTGKDKKAIFELDLLPGEMHNLNTVTGRMSLFVDDIWREKDAKIRGWVPRIAFYPYNYSGDEGWDKADRIIWPYNMDKGAGSTPAERWGPYVRTSSFQAERTQNLPWSDPRSYASYPIWYQPLPRFGVATNIIPWKYKQWHIVWSLWKNRESMKDENGEPIINDKGDLVWYGTDENNKWLKFATYSPRIHPSARYDENVDVLPFSFSPRFEQYGTKLLEKYPDGLPGFSTNSNNSNNPNEKNYLELAKYANNVGNKSLTQDRRFPQHKGKIDFIWGSRCSVM